MGVHPWLILLAGLVMLVISPFVARGWEALGFGLLATAIGSGLLILNRWMDRNIK